MNKEDGASPTVMTASVLLTGTIDAEEEEEERDIMTSLVPNAFPQTEVPLDGNQIRGLLVDMLVELAPRIYGPYYVRYENGQKVLYIQVLKAILQNDPMLFIIFYKKFRNKDLSRR
jgi:hypothetical protein